MATTRHDTVGDSLGSRPSRPRPLPLSATAEVEATLRREGAHGPRVFDWARVEVRPWREDRRHWVIARRSVSRLDEISYYIGYCPADTTLDQLIHIAGSRSAVEEFQLGITRPDRSVLVAEGAALWPRRHPGGLRR